MHFADFSISFSYSCFVLLKVDWLNRFIETMWPYLDKVCSRLIVGSSNFVLWSFVFIYMVLMPLIFLMPQIF